MVSVEVADPAGDNVKVDRLRELVNPLSPVVGADRKTVPAKLLRLVTETLVLADCPTGIDTDDGLTDKEKSGT